MGPNWNGAKFEIRTVRFYIWKRILNMIDSIMNI